MANSNNNDGCISGIYGVGSSVFGGIAFLACWYYAVETYGLFLGIGLGWIPSLFIGMIVGAFWPIILLVIIILGFFLWKSMHGA